MTLLTIEDRYAIHELIAKYGHLMDEREFSKLDEIFTSDAVFDLNGYGGAKYQGLAAIIELMSNSTEHPLAHHATNVVVRGLEHGVVEVISKGLGVGHRGRAGSVVYRDSMVRSDGGWRISERQVELRTNSGSTTKL